MATDVRQLLLQIDASTELLRKHLAEGEAELARFQQRTDDFGNAVDQRITRASGRAAGSVEQLRAGSQQLSYQISDVSASFASGTPVIQIFSQQIGQTIQAVQLMTNATGGFIGFMAGPWGAALVGAGSILATLASKYLDGSEAAKEKQKAADALARSMDALRETTDRQVFSEQRFAKAAYDSARAALSSAQAKASAARIELQARILSRDVAYAGVGDDENANAGAALVGYLRSGGVEEQRKKLAELRKQENIERELLRKQDILQAEQGIAGRLDRATAATARYSAQLDALKQRYTEGKSTLSEYTAASERLQRAQKSELDAISESEKRSGGGLTKEQRDAQRAAAKAAREQAADLKKDAAELQSLLDRLFPETAKARKFGDDIGFLSEQMRAGKLSTEQLSGAIDALYRERFGSERDKLGDLLKVDDLGLRDIDVGKEALFVAKRVKGPWADIQAANDNLRESFAETARGIAGSMDQLANDLRGGDILDVTQGLLDLFLQLGSTGLFGQRLATNINAPRGGLRGYAGGGQPPVGVPSLVGERGPELFIPKVPGTIVPNHALGGNVLHFDLRGAVMTEDLLRQMQVLANGAAGAGSADAQVRIAQRGARRLG